MKTKKHSFWKLDKDTLTGIYVFALAMFIVYLLPVLALSLKSRCFVSWWCVA